MGNSTRGIRVLYTHAHIEYNPRGAVKPPSYPRRDTSQDPYNRAYPDIFLGPTDNLLTVRFAYNNIIAGARR